MEGDNFLFTQENNQKHFFKRKLGVENCNKSKIFFLRIEKKVEKVERLKIISIFSSGQTGTSSAGVA